MFGNPSIPALTIICRRSDHRRLQLGFFRFSFLLEFHTHTEDEDDDEDDDHAGQQGPDQSIDCAMWQKGQI